jgi:hypothetical protein
VGAYLLLLDPWDLHPIDGWLQERLGYHTMAEMEPGADEMAALYTCPMHPHILEEEPGECPICGMDLVAATVGEEREILFYRNPMDPAITSPVPLQDEMGMDYVPVYADDSAAPTGEGTTIRIDPVVVQNMNVQSAPVERRDLRHHIRTVGYLEYDQERMVTVTRSTRRSWYRPRRSCSRPSGTRDASTNPPRRPKGGPRVWWRLHAPVSAFGTYPPNR